MCFSRWRLASRVLLVCAAVWLLSASPAAAQYLRGIDVSSWQGTINWAQVAADEFDPELVDYPFEIPTAAGERIAFAYIRATRGTNQQDVKFAANTSGARANGIRVGAYHFAKPNLGNTAAAEAQYFINYARANGGLQPGDLRPVVDIEGSNTTNTASAEYGGSNGLSVAALSQWVTNYCTAVRNAIGVEPIVYCNTNYATNYLNNTMYNKTLWIANWSQEVPGTGNFADWTFWQWSSKTQVTGISGNVDADVFKGTLADLDAVSIPRTVALRNSVRSGTALARSENGLRRYAESGSLFGPFRQGSFVMTLTVVAGK